MRFDVPPPLSTAPHAVANRHHFDGAEPVAASVGLRLHAARLAAGFVFIADAAWAFDVPADHLTAMEAGERPIDDDVLTLLPMLYGVSSTYLRDAARSEREQFADRLVRIIDIVSNGEGEHRRWWSKRLARIRARSGLGSEDDFRSQVGWLFPIYVASQTESPSSSWATDASLDLQISLCLAMRGMPEFGVLSALPVLPRADSDASWWRAFRREYFAYVPLPLYSDEEWDWLDHGASDGDDLVIQIVEFVDNAFMLSCAEPLRIPRSVLPASGSAAGRSVYGLRLGDTEIVILDPERGDGDCLLVDPNSTLTVGRKRDPFEPSQDPIGFSVGDHASGSLGAIVMRMRTAS